MNIIIDLKKQYIYNAFIKVSIVRYVNEMIITRKKSKLTFNIMFY